MSDASYFPQAKNAGGEAGFTLIEVLIALAIIGIAMSAIIKAASQNIKDTHYLQQKTMATWVGTEVIHATQAGILKLPKEPDDLQEETDMLGQTWSWKAHLAPTPNPKVQEIKVNVFYHSEESPLASMTGFYYAQ